MKKASFFITSEATKYWKKEVKNGRLQVATKGDKIYILNNYNAFIIPNNPYVYAELVQPATLRPAPEDGRAFIWLHGGLREDSADDTVNIIERNIEEGTGAAERTRFTVDVETAAYRVYKAANGQLAAVNAKYDSMVEHSFSHELTMKDQHSPAILRDGDFLALLLPCRQSRLESWARDLIG